MDIIDVETWTDRADHPTQGSMAIFICDRRPVELQTVSLPNLPSARVMPVCQSSTVPPVELSTAIYRTFSWTMRFRHQKSDLRRAPCLTTADVRPLANRRAVI
jgi:hypothetical protein